MRFSSHSRFIWFFGSVFIFIFSAVGIAALTTNRPWGVPEQQLDLYDELMAKSDQRDLLVKISKATGAAKLFLKKPTVLFEDALPNSEATGEFQIQNEGGKPLSLEIGSVPEGISGIQSEKVIVEPGEIHTMPFRYTVPDEAVQSKDDGWDARSSIKVKTDDPLSPEVTLQIYTSIVPHWQWTAQRLEATVVPGEPLESKIILMSRLYEHTLITKYEATDPAMIVDIESVGTKVLSDLEAKSAVIVKVNRPSLKENTLINESLTFSVENGESVSKTMTIPLVGRARDRVIFSGPNIHQATGFELGTIQLQSEDTWSFIVRFLGEEPPKEPAVLDIEPKVFQAELTPQKRSPGAYRLTIRLADDAKPISFSGFPHQGYVEVGDRANPGVSNWMPITGEVIPRITER